MKTFDDFLRSIDFDAFNQKIESQAGELPPFEQFHERQKCFVYELLRSYHEWMQQDSSSEK